MTATVQEVVQRANPAAPVARVRSILGALAAALGRLAGLP